MECAGIPVDAHATNDSMRIGARRRAAKAAQVRQTIRSTLDTYMLRRRSRAGIRPGGHTDSSMNQKSPPSFAPCAHPPPSLLAARGIAADGSRLA